MKKLLAILLVAVMLFALAACSTTPADNGKVTKDNIKVGFIFLHDENSTYDANFINAANAACANLGVTGILKTNVPEGQECYEAAAELVDAVSERND